MMRQSLIVSSLSILSACNSGADAPSGSTSTIDAGHALDAADAATPSDPTLGAPCNSDDQCHVGKCLTEAMNPRFVGGICTFFDVRGPEDCPPGTSYAGGTSTPACLVRCKTTSECRKGWQCCVTPGSDSIACTVPDGICEGPVL
jgi:hypothetical protein